MKMAPDLKTACEQLLLAYHKTIWTQDALLNAVDRVQLAWRKKLPTVVGLPDSSLSMKNLHMDG